MMQVNQLCDLYLGHARVYYVKPKTGRQTAEYGLIERALDAIRAVAGGVEVTAVDATTLSAARRWLLDETENCRNTVNGKVSRIVRMFTWGAEPEQRFVPALVVAELSLLKPLKFGRSTARETEGLDAVSRERVMDLLAVLMEPPRSKYGHECVMTPKQRRARLQLATMIELQLETGMRSGELCALDLSRVDRSGPEWVYRPGEHKTEHRGKERVVVIFAQGQALIDRWAQVSGYVSGRLFSISRTAYRLNIVRACERSGLEPWTPHQLRHTFATEVRDAADLDAAQVLLGHSSSRTTERYAGVDRGRVVEKMRAAGR